MVRHDGTDKVANAVRAAVKNSGQCDVPQALLDEANTTLQRVYAAVGGKAAGVNVLLVSGTGRNRMYRFTDTCPHTEVLEEYRRLDRFRYTATCTCTRCREHLGVVTRRGGEAARQKTVTHPTHVDVVEPSEEGALDIGVGAGQGGGQGGNPKTKGQDGQGEQEQKDGSGGGSEGGKDEGQGDGGSKEGDGEGGGEGQGKGDGEGEGDGDGDGEGDGEGEGDGDGEGEGEGEDEGEGEGDGEGEGEGQDGEGGEGEGGEGEDGEDGEGGEGEEGEGEGGEGEGENDDPDAAFLRAFAKHWNAAPADVKARHDRRLGSLRQ